MALVNFEGTVLYNLINSTFAFHLTGSRFFKVQTKISDWDFFVKYEESVITFLIDLGFKETNISSYSDRGVVAVYRHHEGVDVQLVKDPSLRQRIQEVFKSSGNIPHKENQKATETWNFAYDIAMSMVGHS